MHTRSQSEAEKRRINTELAEKEIALFEEEGQFTFVKMHLLLHFSDSIRRFGPFSHFNTEVPEHSHRQQISQNYKRSNKNATYLKQILAAWGRYYAIVIRELLL